MELILHEKGMIWVITIILHLLFVMIGMGSAIISDILFSFFSKDKKIDKKEDSILNILSNTTWVSLVGMLVTGFLLFLHNPERYGSSADFLSKMSMVVILMLNGLIFAFYIHPNLRHLSFTDTNNTHRLVRVRKISFAYGALSITTWLSIFILALIDKITLTHVEIMATYGVIVICAMLLSQVVDKLQARQ